MTALLPLSLAMALAQPPAAPAPATATPGARRGPGPAGSLLIVEEAPALPLVTLVVAARTGSATDPRGKEGLANLAAELARRGAASKPRAALDEAVDALGATLEADVDADSLRFVGQVLERNLDPFLALLADVLLRPDFPAAELTRTRREILADIDEARNDDRALCQRFFERRLFGDHPYGHPPEGTAKSLPRIRREDLVAHWKHTVTGPNLVFAAAGAVTLDGFRARLRKAFARLPSAPAPAQPAVPTPAKADGWRIQIVDKPDRQQAQVMLGHAAIPAAHPDRLPLLVALASFGGRGMKATLMDEVRTKRGLAYGAYMGLVQQRGPSAVRAWVSMGADRAVTTLKLVLRLYKTLRKQGITEERVRFFQNFLAGTFASDMDDPTRRLIGRVSGEIQGLPADALDTFPARIRAVTPAEVNAAIERYLDPDHLTITMVATADVMVPLLTKAKVAEAALDVVNFESY
jgi:zinc protease